MYAVTTNGCGMIYIENAMTGTVLRSCNPEVDLSIEPGDDEAIGDAVAQMLRASMEDERMNQ